MSRALDELLKEERDVGMTIGMEKSRTSMIEAMRENGLTEEQIAAVLKTAEGKKVS